MKTNTFDRRDDGYPHSYPPPYNPAYVIVGVGRNQPIPMETEVVWTDQHLSYFRRRPFIIRRVLVTTAPSTMKATSGATAITATLTILHYFHL